MKPIIHIKNKNIYIIFQDGQVAQNKDGYRETLKTIIKNGIEDIVLANNVFNIIEKNSQIIQNNERYKSFNIGFSTYIKDLTDNNDNVYYLNVYIIPKEFNLIFNEKYSDSNNVKWIEAFSMSLFSTYARNIEPRNKLFEIFKTIKGDSLIDLEAGSYINILKKISNLLSNFNRDRKTKTIVSDQIIGVLNHIENEKTGNPFRLSQKINTFSESEVVPFVYSLLLFFETQYLPLFKTRDSFSKLSKLIKGIKNKLNNIEDKIKITKINVKKDRSIALNNFFKTFRNKDEIKSNPQIFKLMKELFFNSIESSNIFFKTINISKFLENRLTEELSIKYTKKQNWIGCENKKDCYNIENKSDTLKKVFFSSKRKDRQCLPDNLIGDHDYIHSIYDAKYYTLENLTKNTELFLKMYGYQKAFSDFLNKNKTPVQNTYFIIPEEFEINVIEDSPYIKLKKTNKCNFKKIDTYDILDIHINVLKLSMFEIERNVN